MYLEGIMHSELSKVERDIPDDFTNLWNIKAIQKKQNSCRLSHGEVTSGHHGGGVGTGGG